MNYELAKQLKDAGFPQKEHGTLLFPLITTLADSQNKMNQVGSYAPTLEELIEACPKQRDFPELELINLPFDLCFSKRIDGWLAGYEHYDYFAGDILGEGSTPTESVANLWLVLNKKSA